MTRPPKTLLLFVHGFLGSESSFESFPLDLVQSLRKLYDIRDLEARVFPLFSTKGDLGRSVDLLYNWMLLNASKPEFEAVIVVAHSIGGLICADVFAKLSNLTRRSDQGFMNRDFTKESTFDGNESACLEADSSVPLTAKKSYYGFDFFDNWFNKTESLNKTREKCGSLPRVSSNNTDKHIPTASSSVNFAALICFDSPFYGINSTVFTTAAGDQAADIISSYLPESHSKQINSALKYGSHFISTAIISGLDILVAIPAICSNTLTSAPSYVDHLFQSLPSPASVITSAIIPIQALPSTLYLGVTIALSTPTSFSGYFWNTEDGTTNQSLDISSVSIKSGHTNQYLDISGVSGKCVTLDQQNLTNLTSIAVPPVSQMIVSKMNTNQKKVVTMNSSFIQDKDVKNGWNNVRIIIDNDAIGQHIFIDKGDVEIAAILSDFHRDSQRIALVPTYQEIDMQPCITFGIAALAIACGTYYCSAGIAATRSIHVVKRLALTYAVTRVEDVRQHLKFLYPIWGESVAILEARIRYLQKAMAQNKFLFKCFYVKVRCKVEGTSRTFIKLGLPLNSDLFVPIGSDALNVISGHVKMFSRRQNPVYYWELVHRASLDILHIIHQTRRTPEKTCL